MPKASPLTHLKELDELSSRSFMISGSPMSELAQLLSNQNIQASIQNQALQIRRNGEPIQKEAIVLNAGSALREFPDIGSIGFVGYGLGYFMFLGLF